jgi:hypothetical protein
MGKYDSSRTRVAPVFNWLQCWDPSGKAWLPALVALADPTRATLHVTRLTEALWWPCEARLPPANSLLQWLIENCEEPATDSAWGESDETRAYRRRLVDRHEATKADALAILSRGQVSKAPHVLEGPSQPDAYLATPEVIVVVEGKRTENGPTTWTLWMRLRHQMLRHLDGAWEQRNGRPVLGLIILEEEDIAAKPWANYVSELALANVLSGSLPHRSLEERSLIAQSFCGIISWKAVRERFNVPAEALPDEVLEGIV